LQDWVGRRNLERNRADRQSEHEDGKQPAHKGCVA